MNIEGQFIPSRKCVYFMFGRFQPPHIGHIKMIKSGFDAAKHNHCDLIVFTSASHDDKKNPLDVNLKVDILKKQLSNMIRDGQLTGQHVDVIGANVLNPRSVRGAIDFLKNAGYEKLTLVVGQDRASDFSWVHRQGVDLDIVPRPEGAISGTAVREIITEQLQNIQSEDQMLSILRDKLEDKSLGHIDDDDIRRIYYGVRGESSDAEAATALVTMLSDTDNFDPREGDPFQAEGGKTRKRSHKKRKPKSRRNLHKSKKKRKRKERNTRKYKKRNRRFTKGKFMNIS